MKTREWIEVPVSYRMIGVRRASPFHWALMRSVQLFAPGVRPRLDELTHRLQLGEPAFLNEAWRELKGWHAVDEADFMTARLTLEGADALRTGGFATGSVVERSRVVSFSTDGEWLRSGGTAGACTRKLLTVKPSWAATITAEDVERFLRTDAVADDAQRDVRWQDLCLAWDNASVVVADEVSSGA